MPRDIQEALDEAREAYVEFQEKWSLVGRMLRHQEDGRWLHNRVDAYPSWDGTRDVGCGQSFPEWMDEIQQWIEDR